MTTETDWVPEDVDETIVIASGDHAAVKGLGHTIHVCSISALGEDSLNAPSKLAGAGCPLGFGSVSSARWVMCPRTLTVGEEEEFVSTTVGPDVSAVLTPV